MAPLLYILMLLVPLAADDEQAPQDQTARQLAKVRRIYVDILTGGDTALQIRELLMTSLQRSKLFIITENEDKADAVLKGAGEDEVFTDTFQSSEGINAHSQVGEAAARARETTPAVPATIAPD
jgi:hypothetical protein